MDVSLTVHDEQGNRVAALQPSDRAGLNRVIWDLRHDVPGAEDVEMGFGGNGLRGPRVVPGLYTVRMEAGGAVAERVVRVQEDPRIEVDPKARADWTGTLMEITELLVAGQTLAAEAEDAVERLDEGEVDVSDEVEAEVRDLSRELDELASRTGRLLRNVEGWVGPLAADDASQKAFLEEMYETLVTEWSAVRGRVEG
jgi:hypothetical protein